MAKKRDGTTLMLRKETHQFKDIYVHWKRESDSYSIKRLM